MPVRRLYETPTVRWVLRDPWNIHPLHHRRVPPGSSDQRQVRAVQRADVQDPGVLEAAEEGRQVPLVRPSATLPREVRPKRAESRRFLPSVRAPKVPDSRMLAEGSFQRPLLRVFT